MADMKYDEWKPIAQEYGKLEIAYERLVNSDTSKFKDLSFLVETFRAVDQYSNLVKSHTYIGEDLMDNQRLEKLKEKCNSLLEKLED